MQVTTRNQIDVMFIILQHLSFTVASRAGLILIAIMSPYISQINTLKIHCLLGIKNRFLSSNMLELSHFESQSLLW